MKTVLSRKLAAKALDMTHDIGEVGPKTYNSRQRVAKWLDIGGRVTSSLRGDVARLLSLSSK